MRRAAPSWTSKCPTAVPTSGAICLISRSPGARWRPSARCAGSSRPAHLRSGTVCSTPTTPPATSPSTRRPSARRLALVEAQHPRRRLELHPRLRRRGVAASSGTKRSAPTAGGSRSSSTTTATPPSTMPAPAVASQFLLRMYLEKRDPRFRGSARPRSSASCSRRSSREGRPTAAGRSASRRLRLRSSSMPLPDPRQLPAGATPRHGGRRLHPHVTFNDDVVGENIKFLLMCVIGARASATCSTRAAGHGVPAPSAAARRRRRAGACSTCAQRPDGRPAGAPAGARSYEPRALATHTTQTNVRQLFNYFRLTGDRKYLRASAGGDRLAERAAGSRRK